MDDFDFPDGVRFISPSDKWCVHAYYSLCPWAPDGSGRILFAGADPDSLETSVYVASPDGGITDNFGGGKAESSFFHTGSWQTWGRDSSRVYYQGGTMKNPQICRYDLASGTTSTLDGDMEGAPPFDEPIVSGLLGMLYAAGYADGRYHPDDAPIPFADRDGHGLFCFDITERKRRLALSVNDILRRHPDMEKLLALEEEYKERTGHAEGFTLMAYCVRWNTKGDRCLFYFGNHCVAKSREEPRLCYVFTARADLTDIRLALDLSFDTFGVHWSWHPDGEHLVGYASHPDNGGKLCLCTVRYDGSDFRMISRHASGGHSSISPADYRLLVTDEGYGDVGRIVFIDLECDEEVGEYRLPRRYGDNIPSGRNKFWVCHHPVFSRDGKTILANCMRGRNAAVCTLDVKGRKKPYGID